MRRLIPTSHGTLRPRGLPALEEKIVAKAVAMRLEASAAQDFGDCSYGFCPGRRPPPALHEGRQGVLTHGSSAVLDGDSSACCDHVPHTTRVTMRRQRSKGGRVLERSERWRHAGILDGKARGCPDTGRPQGSVRSPL